VQKTKNTGMLICWHKHPKTILS